MSPLLLTNPLRTNAPSGQPSPLRTNPLRTKPCGEAGRRICRVPAPAGASALGPTQYTCGSRGARGTAGSVPACSSELLAEPGSWITLSRAAPGSPLESQSHCFEQGGQGHLSPHGGGGWSLEPLAWRGMCPGRGRVLQAFFAFPKQESNSPSDGTFLCSSRPRPPPAPPPQRVLNQRPQGRGLEGHSRLRPVSTRPDLLC